MIKNIFFLLAAAFGLSSCLSCAMDPITFAEIDVGSNIQEVVDCVGCPYEILQCPDGTQKYIYVLRQNIVPRVKRFQRYVLTVEDGAIVDKCFDQQERKDFYYLPDGDLR